MRVPPTIETGDDAAGWTLYRAIATGKGLRCEPIGYSSRRDAIRAFGSVTQNGAWCRVVEHATEQDTIGNIIAEAGELPGQACSSMNGEAFARAKYHARKG